MSLPDATASAALDAAVIKPVFFVYCDVLGDPVRANTSGVDITPTGTGDPDLDDLTFVGVDASVLDVSPVMVGAGGSDSVNITLSAIRGLDDTLLGQVADTDSWRGREARLWRVIRNAANVQQGGFHAFYTGRMSALAHGSDDNGQFLRVTVETYLAALSEASNRTYLDQERYDPGDLSARAAIAIANGNYSGRLVSSRYTRTNTGGALTPRGGFRQ